ncbi:L,D-transpeptidase [Longimicrobium sp.]|uniref:L,D-transpeptidase n=1 Tax=Longimicrobium sp. TaxID=2029185 RepID=UPI003B3B649F
MRRLKGIHAVIAAAALAMGGCVVQDKTDDQAAAGGTTVTQQQPPAGQPAATPAPTPAPTPALPPPDLRLEVNVAERELYVYRNDQRIATHPVAVGTSEWPTQTGEWTIGQVVFNPRWTPPKEEEWAKDEEVKEPGAPDNPLGHAQLVYDAPRSIHGTNEPESLGKAESHGSIRIANSVAVQLSRMVMEAGGASRDEAFFEGVRSNRKERVEVAIPNPIPIRVVSGGSGDSGGGGSGEKGKSGETSKSGSGN